MLRVADKIKLARVIVLRHHSDFARFSLEFVKIPSPLSISLLSGVSFSSALQSIAQAPSKRTKSIILKNILALLSYIREQPFPKTSFSVLVSFPAANVQITIHVQNSFRLASDCFLGFASIRPFCQSCTDGECRRG
jgi:hypothetical protein